MSMQRAKTNADAVHPITSAVAVTASDATVLKPFRALWVGVGGTVIVRFLDESTTATFAGVPSGTLLPVQGDQVRASSSATSILALY